MSLLALPDLRSILASSRPFFLDAGCAPGCDLGGKEVLLCGTSRIRLLGLRV